MLRLSYLLHIVPRLVRLVYTVYLRWIWIFVLGHLHIFLLQNEIDSLHNSQVLRERAESSICGQKQI